MGRFSRSLSREIRALRADISDTLKETIITFAGKLVERSPVGDPSLWQNPRPPAGYQPGHFVKNWQITNNKNAVEIQGYDPRRKDSIQAMTNFVNSSTVGGIYWVSNMVPYAQRLEDGHSTQAPRGMVALTVLEFNGILQRAAQ